MRVMLAYDGSACAEAARDLLAHLSLPAGSAVTLVMALEQGPRLYGSPDLTFAPGGAEESEALLIADLQEMLHAAAAPLRASDRQVETRIVRGRPASALLDEARASLPDLLVAGSRGHGPLSSMVLGSVSTELVDHAPCPVLVARHPSVHRLVVGVDGSATAAQAVGLLRRWPIFAGLRARVVAVASPVTAWAGTFGSSFYPAWVELHEPRADERERLLRVADRAADDLAVSGMSAGAELRDGDAADQLLQAATEEGADLIVVGSRGLSTVPRIVLGSVARKVLLHAPQSVLVVHQARERVRRPRRVRERAMAPPAGAAVAPG